MYVYCIWYEQIADDFMYFLEGAYAFVRGEIFAPTTELY